MSESGEFFRLAHVENCPICGRKLDKGYLITYRLVAWDSKKHTFSARSAERLALSLYTFGNLPSLRCKECKLVMFIYEGKTPKWMLKKCLKCGEEIPIGSEKCPSCGVKQPEYRD